ncbi:hypothetical protein MMF93_22020 [Streptomyces tubbatahanensis]|uniref:Secreted protein n=1 Tax=Streptomyces tubbatahanensis TaxID=2923272 RepID=A0ABY3XX84_9ACTN|nr:hypothetical protein [Streptomyces tubbatahanensis]UNS98843.1 hypothetical protein MMF93_22020 [Streptomyces tubbatahanensis]
MAALAWLLIPVVAAVAASLWGSWAGRRRAKTPDAVGVAGYERFRAAMERSGTDGAPCWRPESRDGQVCGAEDAHHGRGGAGSQAGERASRGPAAAELASAGAVGHASPDGPARGAG